MINRKKVERKNERKRKKKDFLHMVLFSKPQKRKKIKELFCSIILPFYLKNKRERK